MEQIILNLVPGGVSPVCYVSQYYVGRKIRLHLRNGSDPYVLSGAETVTATIRKVSGEELIYDIANTSASYVDLIVNYDATNVIGESVCELIITESGLRIGSANFKMRIDPDVYSGNQKLEVVTASSPNSLLSFETNIDENLLELKTTFEPKQDLHGYEKPWPAGGINKLEIGGRVSQTTASVTYTSDDNYIYLNGVKNGGGYADMSNLTITLSAGTYYLKAFPISGTTSNTIDLYAYDGSSDLTGSLLSGERTLTLTESKTFRFRFAVWTDGAVLNNYKIGIVISTSSGIDKFYPYENVCPIEGWNETNVTHCGVNLYDNIYAHYRRPVNYLIKDIPLEIGKTYTLKATLKSGGVAVTGCYVGVASKGEQYSEFSNIVPCVKVDGTTATQTFTPTDSWTSPKLIIYDGGNENLFYSLFENYEIQLTQGSTLTEYKPYTSELINLDWNTNQWDEDWELGTLDDSGAWVSGNYVGPKYAQRIMGGKTYYLASPSALAAWYYSADGTPLESVTLINNRTFTTPSNACFLRFRTYAAYGTTYNHDISINYPSTDHTYHPYRGHGVAYNGEVVYKDGGWKLRLLSKVIDLGSLNWVTEDELVTGLTRAPTPDVALLGAKYYQTPICSAFTGVSARSYTAFNYGETGFSNSPNRPFIRVRSSAIIGKSSEEIKTFLTGVTFCYELETPIEIPLDQNSKLATVLGINNLMHDANGGTEVKFFRLIPAS